VEAIVDPAGTVAEFRWRGGEYSVRIPPGEDPLWVRVRNLAGGRLWVVVLRRLPWWRRLVAERRPGAVVVERRALPRGPR
jgi:hypothetical protein